MNQNSEPLKLDKLDRLILNRVQKDFPVALRPYAVLAKQLKIADAKEILRRINLLKQKGLIRRFGPIIDSKKVNFTSTLVAMKVPKNRLKQVGSIVSSFDQVTHNYIRDDAFNLWFTLIAKNKQELSRLLKRIKNKTKVRDILDLPSSRTFKISLNLKV